MLLMINRIFGNMRKIGSFFFFVSLLIGVSCKEKAGIIDRQGSIVVGLDNIVGEGCLTVSSVFDEKDTYYVTLDTITESLLGDFTKLKVYGDKIVILDRDIAKQILVFDVKGRFLYPVGHFGSGKGEYIDPQDFTYSKDDDVLYVLDARLSKVLAYQLGTGQYLKSLDNDFPSLHIHYYDGCIYVDNPKVDFEGEKRDFLLVKLSADTGEVLDTYIEPIKYNGGFDRPLSNVGGPFLMSGIGQFHYSQQFANSVFNIIDDRVQPYLTFESKDWITSEDLQDIDIDRDNMAVHKLIFKNKFNGINNYIETDDFIFCMFLKGVKNQYFIYDKKNAEPFLYSKLADDVFFAGASWSMAKLKYAGCDENGAYFYLSPADVDVLEKSCYLNPLFDSIRRLNDDFNGAVFRYGYKEK